MSIGNDELTDLLPGLLLCAVEVVAGFVEVKEVDLVESMGFMLVRTDDEPEDFVKRALKKPVMMVDSWV